MGSPGQRAVKRVCVWAHGLELKARCMPQNPKAAVQHSTLMIDPKKSHSGEYVCNITTINILTVFRSTISVWAAIFFFGLTGGFGATTHPIVTPLCSTLFNPLFPAIVSVPMSIFTTVLRLGKWITKCDQISISDSNKEHKTS